MYRLLYVSFSILLVAGCSSKPHLSDSLVDLRKMIAMDSVNPVAVKWSHRPRGKDGFLSMGPTDHTLVAVLKFTDHDFRDLQKRCTQDSIGTTVRLQANAFQEWLPESIARYFIKGDHDYYNVSRVTYTTGSIFHSPWMNGLFFFSESNEVFIIMNDH